MVIRILTVSAYIVDFRIKVEFMLSGVIYVNNDGVLNDDKYNMKKLDVFFQEVGNIMYQYELEKTEVCSELDHFL
jgi:hypothetical protein